MSNQRHVKLLRHDVGAWNAWRERSPELQPDLNGANLGWANLMGANLVSADLSDADLSVADLEEASLSKANLNNANLSDTNLSRADLSGADLSGANLSGANLSGANLSDANLNQANLQWSNLVWANLRGVDLSGADLSGTNLDLANLSEAIMAYTVLGDVDLSVTKGLETTYHLGPSTVGIDTIYRSKGMIPTVFLRGVGLPDTFINYVSALTPEDTKFCACFISYAHPDEAFAQQLYADLQQNGVRCWVAPEDLNVGTKTRPTLDESVRVHDKLLLVLSEHSVESRWVDNEVETALNQEHKSDQPILFPVRLDDAINQVDSGWLSLMQDNQHRIRDFSQWQNQELYAEKVQRLLQDLKKT